MQTDTPFRLTNSSFVSSVIFPQHGCDVVISDLREIDNIEIFLPEPAVVGYLQALLQSFLVPRLTEEPEPEPAEEAGMTGIGMEIIATGDDDVEHPTRLHDAPVFGELLEEPFPVTLSAQMFEDIESTHLVEGVIPKRKGADIHIMDNVRPAVRVHIDCNERGNPIIPRLDKTEFLLAAIAATKEKARQRSGLREGSGGSARAVVYHLNAPNSSSFIESHKRILPDAACRSAVPRHLVRRSGGDEEGGMGGDRRRVKRKSATLHDIGAGSSDHDGPLRLSDAIDDLETLAGAGSSRESKSVGDGGVGVHDDDTAGMLRNRDSQSGGRSRDNAGGSIRRPVQFSISGTAIKEIDEALIGGDRTLEGRGSHWITFLYKDFPRRLYSVGLVRLRGLGV